MICGPGWSRCNLRSRRRHGGKVTPALITEGPDIVERNGRLGIPIEPSTLVPDRDGTLLSAATS